MWLGKEKKEGMTLLRLAGGPHHGPRVPAMVARGNPLGLVVLGSPGNGG
jgi:hypothetical protein